MDPLTHRSSYICRQCISTLRRTGQSKHIQQLQRAPWRAASSGSAPKLASSSSSSSGAKQNPKKVSASTTIKSTARNRNDKKFWENEWTIFSADNAALLKKSQAFGDKVLLAKGAPDDALVLEALKVIEFAASQLTRPAQQESTEKGKKSKDNQNQKKPTSAPSVTREQEAQGGLLSLDRTATPTAADINPAHPMSISISTDLLSSLAYKIINHPPVYLTPEVLTSYITIQSLLKRPETFPEILALYASKPIPKPNTDPVRYSVPNPDSHKQAIPKEAADAALDAAVEKKDLGLAVAIIDASYATKAFQRHKFITRALPAIGGIALTPAAAGVLASQLPAYFPIVNPSELIAYATVGMVTYVAGISTLGFVVITTTNDHMERVTWAPGMALRQRWLREEERAAVDKVALAWGFKGGRRGEEEGVEWEGLREWCGLRGMILDKTELMEGME